MVEIWVMNVLSILSFGTFGFTSSHNVATRWIHHDFLPHIFGVCFNNVGVIFGGRKDWHFSFPLHNVEEFFGGGGGIGFLPHNVGAFDDYLLVVQISHRKVWRCMRGCTKWIDDKIGDCRDASATPSVWVGMGPLPLGRSVTPWSVGCLAFCTRMQVGTARDAWRCMWWCAWSIVVFIGLSCRRSGRFGDLFRFRCVRGGWVGHFSLVKYCICLRRAPGVRLVDVPTTVGLNRLGEIRVQTWIVGVQLAHIKSVGHRRGPSSVSSHSEQRHTNAGKNHGVVYLHGRSCSLTDECCVLVWCRGRGWTASSGRYTIIGWRSSVPGTDCGDGVDCCRVLG